MSVPTKNAFSFTTEYRYRLGGEGILSSPGEKDLEVDLQTLILLL